MRLAERLQIYNFNSTKVQFGGLVKAGINPNAV